MITYIGFNACSNNKMSDDVTTGDEYSMPAGVEVSNSKIRARSSRVSHPARDIGQVFCRCPSTAERSLSTTYLVVTRKRPAFLSKSSRPTSSKSLCSINVMLHSSRESYLCTSYSALSMFAMSSGESYSFIRAR